MLIVALAITPIDYQLTLAVSQHSWPLFKNFYSRTLFEGDLPGAGDFSVIGMLICLIAYIFSHHKDWLKPYRSALGFAIFSALISAVCFVQTTKWVVGRARPKEVIKHHLAFSDWFAIGPHFISEGNYRGSFPSGHTVTALLPLILAYILAGNRRHSSTVRLAGFLIGAAALVNASLMALARAMALSHWLSDGLLGMLMAWGIIHICYFWILRLPEQDQLGQIGKASYIPCNYWEFFLGLWTLGLAVGVMCFFLGIRAVIRGESPRFALLLPTGLALGSFCIRHWLVLYRRSAPLPNSISPKSAQTATGQAGSASEYSNDPKS